MTAVADLLNSAGPFAGWVSFALLTLTLLWAYAGDRLVSHGRHREQADHFQQQLDTQREHFETALNDLQDRLDAHASDRSYWRDTALDLMAVAAKVTRDE